jgi:hypothetical protein
MCELVPVAVVSAALNEFGRGNDLDAGESGGRLGGDLGGEHDDVLEGIEVGYDGDGIRIIES